MESPACSSIKLSSLCLAVGMALANPVLAQEPDSHFEEVVVWGTKVSSNTESMFADDMSLKQADHMSDLLRDIPGVDVGGTHSVNQRITIRGLGETDLDIRLDGASQHASMFHHIGNLTLNPDILKSADIQVGNNSVTQNGLGGSVYFETKDARDLLRYDETFGARVYGGFASNDNQQGSLTLYGLLSENVDAMVYGHYVTRDDFKDGNGDKTFGSAGDVYNILAKLGYEFNDIHRFELSYDMYRDSGDYSPRPDMAGSANNGLSSKLLIPTDYDRDTVTLSYELRGEQHQGNVTLYNTETEIKRDETVMAPRWPSNRLSKNTAKNQNLGLNAKFQSDFALAQFDNRVTYGFDYMDKTSSSYYGSSKFMDESAVSTALFVEDQFFFSDAFFITAGLRFDDYKRKAETGTSNFDDVTWALAAEWAVTQDWTLFASSRSLFKGPELMETFIAYQDVAYLDEGMKAETGQNTQGGLRFNKTLDKHFFGANVTVFQTNIDDYIADKYQDATQTYLIYNIGDVEIKGFEASASYGYDKFNSKISYSQSDTKNKNTGGPVAGGNGRSIDMGDSIALTLDYQSDSLETIFGWTSMFVLEEDNVFDGQPAKDSYDVHNLYAQWVPSNVDGLSVTFGIDNIFDEVYTSHASRSGTVRGFTLDDYEPGRNFKLSAAYQF
ncbi:TPA: TonB-dependent siderophore receptor [Vibrio parahaemolyticus]|uniref:TonB-dependent siderophore receptor n=1 Tax=Vibrio parahaemolyticus TaxID=670 RepID=UPI00084B9FD2|nr:TonB-dependent siderophore receptor [Vibrio parahaemolyticus]AYO07539.1 TonB-dependent siderophore receptor [Vibrio parahaemolyticus]EGQ9441330.1 TonB-dependent siderophore receptor [Vibrio parahaemolyticus]EGQ9917837.1 TonB-dependent siderophore receptor [Vibrio parahaemolyticus]EGR3369325.1 TonB-dependent siderophore receptor [Vibrio parahaemolyticus]EHZ2904848.1 TonB-dependent siderophore receptor [Vibrio parahaemolyticus]